MSLLLVVVVASAIIKFRREGITPISVRVVFGRYRSVKLFFSSLRVFGLSVKRGVKIAQQSISGRPSERFIRASPSTRVAETVGKKKQNLQITTHYCCHYALETRTCLSVRSARIVQQHDRIKIIKTYIKQI